jgi:hypothetical protein
MRETQFVRLCPHRKEVSHESDVREGQHGHADKCFHGRPGQPTATCLTSNSRNRRGCQPSAGIHFVITPSQHRWRKSDHAFHDPCSHPTRNSIFLRQTDNTAQNGYRFGWALINLRRPLRWHRQREAIRAHARSELFTPRRAARTTRSHRAKKASDHGRCGAWTGRYRRTKVNIAFEHGLYRGLGRA